jgi:hypothetical protein
MAHPKAERTTEGAPRRKRAPGIPPGGYYTDAYDLCAGDGDKIKLSLLAFTKNDAKDTLGKMTGKIGNRALPVVYANIKKTTRQRPESSLCLRRRQCQLSWATA